MNKTTGSSLHGSTLSIGALQEGFVLDHIEAGHAMTIYRYLKLGKLDCTVAIIKNATSNKMGRKDIIKVDCPIDYLDLDVLGFIDHNITVNVIKDGVIIDKKRLSLPPSVTNVISCKNPRCITSIESGLDQIFILSDPEKGFEFPTATYGLTEAEPQITLELKTKVSSSELRTKKFDRTMRIDCIMLVPHGISNVDEERFEIAPHGDGDIYQWRKY